MHTPQSQYVSKLYSYRQIIFEPGSLCFNTMRQKTYSTIFRGSTVLHLNIELVGKKCQLNTN